MPVVPGSRLGPYEILAAIGAGGMGEVYRARDSKLGRDVAIKVLPASLTEDSDRLARFTREAQVLAALNHPNIAAIYGLEGREGREGQDGTPAIVMELVEGETLADRIARGAIPIDEALPIAKQIADALEAAHEQGIIHRDLKPANIKVTPNGLVKVLDFGLAKLAEPAAGSPQPVANLSLSPTITSPALMTGVGMLLGTAAYMAPEQARGRAVDKRSDIWAFGCVLFEMLTGERAFGGEDIPDVMVAILSNEPNWAMLSPTAPSIRKLLKRCLEKDRKLRLRDIGDAGLAIDDILVAPGSDVVAQPATGRWGMVAGVTAAAFLVTTMILGWVAFRPAAVSSIQRLSILPPNETSIDDIAVSPEGRRLAFTALSAGKWMLWIRGLDSGAASPLPGTEGAAKPFWSPDSQSVAFFAGDKLKRIAASGGGTQALADTNGGEGGTWNRDGVILFVPSQFAPVYRVSAPGLPPTKVTAFDPSRGESAHRYPQFLPDGRHFIYAAIGRDSNWIKVGTIDSTETTSLIQVDPGDAKAVYVRTSGRDYLLFIRQRTLLAQRFDPEARTLSGEPTAVSDELIAEDANGGNQRIALLSASATGIVAYRPVSGGGERQIAWVDRSGKTIAAVGAPGLFNHVELSPDAKRIVVDRLDGRSNKTDLWLLDVATGSPTRFTFEPDQYSVARWSIDGRHLLFPRVGDRKGIYQKLSTGAGAEEQLVPSPHDGLIIPDSVSPDGRFLVVVDYAPGALSKLSILRTSGNRQLTPVPNTQVQGANGRVSPDGRWLAYQSAESGRAEVYVQPIPPSGAKWQISRDGGMRPRWRRDGAELYFIGADATLMAAPIAGGVEFQSGVPAALFPLKYSGLLVAQYPYDVSADGQKFLIIAPAQAQDITPVTVLLNWRPE